ncbi:MAG: hypothetical protein ABSA64_04945 [Sedimentisphaerales bacterium]|jgi:hypothetical protein
MELRGTFLGKQFIGYEPEIECTENDFKEFVSKFNRLNMLKKICSLASELFNRPEVVFKFGDVPVSGDILCDFAYRVIKYCDEGNQLKMSDSQIEFALKMCHKLYNKIFENIRNEEEILTKACYRQFPFQHKQTLFNNLTRNLYLYTDLWNRVSESQSINIRHEIEDEMGLPYDYALYFTYMLMGKDSYFWILEEDEVKKINQITGLSFTVEFHHNFTKWCSGTYENILSHDNLLPAFVRYPIIATNAKPLPGKGEVFVVVSQHLLHDKLTSGLYFHLIDRFNEGNKRNKFKEIFGHVFQEYIGELLKYYFKTWKVIPEIKYKKEGRKIQDSVDWFIKKDNKLIMIEVKQSSIFLKAKQEPSVQEIISDLKKTIIRAVEQLNTTEEDIKTNKYPELCEFDNINSFVKIIVVHDPLYNANYLVKKIMSKEVADLKFQIININEFEILVSNQKQSESLFDILKRKADEDNEMDFNEYILKIFPTATSNIEFLKPIWERFIAPFPRNK